MGAETFFFCMKLCERYLPRTIITKNSVLNNILLGHQMKVNQGLEWETLTRTNVISLNMYHSFFIVIRLKYTYREGSVFPIVDWEQHNQNGWCWPEWKRKRISTCADSGNSHTHKRTKTRLRHTYLSVATVTIFQLLEYTGGILQSVVRHRCAQCCGSEKEHSILTAMVLIVMLQHWQCWDSSGSGNAEIMMCT